MGLGWDMFKVNLDLFRFEVQGRLQELHDDIKYQMKQVEKDWEKSENDGPLIRNFVRTKVQGLPPLTSEEWKKIQEEEHKEKEKAFREWHRMQQQCGYFDDDDDDDDDDSNDGYTDEEISDTTEDMKNLRDAFDRFDEATKL